MFRIEMLPAAHGDCLWIEYGTGQRAYRILIDGGPAATYHALRERILALPAGGRTFELLVITHIDGDHIEGIIRLLQDAEALGCTFQRIWFNGLNQLNKVPDPAGSPMGAEQGEMLSLLIDDYERNSKRSVWNADLPDRVAVIDRAAETLPAVCLDGDCRLTLLSPDHERLLELKTHWVKELKKARLEPGAAAQIRYALEHSRTLQPLGDVLGGEDSPTDSWYEYPDPDGRDLIAAPEDQLGAQGAEPGGNAAFGSDGSLANGSSIALLLEYPKEKPQVRLMLCGDAWASVLEESVVRLLGSNDKKLDLTGIKLPHHGSVANVTPELLGRLRCKNYLISTSGAVFRHPHARAVNLLLDKHQGKGKPRLHFNYRSETTLAWDDSEEQRKKGYLSFHPKGLTLSF